MLVQRANSQGTEGMVNPVSYHIVYLRMFPCCPLRGPLRCKQLIFITPPGRGVGWTKPLYEAAEAAEASAFFFFCFIPFITIATYMETLIEGTTDGRYTWQCLCFCHATARGIPCTTKQDQRCGKNLGASQTKRGGSQRRSGIRKTKRAKKKKVQGSMSSVCVPDSR